MQFLEFYSWFFFLFEILTFLMPQCSQGSFQSSHGRGGLDHLEVGSLARLCVLTRGWFNGISPCLSYRVYRGLNLGIRSKTIFSGHFWPLLKWVVFFEVAGSVAKISSCLKLEMHWPNTKLNLKTRLYE